MSSRSFNKMVKYKLLCFLVVFTTLINFSHATSLRAVGLNEMHSLSKYIFYGKCIGNQVQLDDKTGFIVTYTTFQIREKFKGELSDQYTIKQIGGTLENGSHYRITDIPKFTVNKKYVLFLPGKSKLGFSSPIALSKGQFIVSHSHEESEALVSNGEQFSVLLSATPDQDLTLPALNKKNDAITTDKEKKENSHMRLDNFKSLLSKMSHKEDDDEDDDDKDHDDKDDDDKDHDDKDDDDKDDDDKDSDHD